MGRRSPSSHWCVLRNNSNIRTAVQSRIKERGYTLKELEKHTGILADRISKYRNGKRKSITQYQLFTLCEFLGIEIDVQIKFIK